MRIDSKLPCMLFHNVWPHLIISLFSLSLAAELWMKYKIIMNKHWTSNAVKRLLPLVHIPSHTMGSRQPSPIIVYWVRSMHEATIDKLRHTGCDGLTNSWLCYTKQHTIWWILLPKDIYIYIPMQHYLQGSVCVSSLKCDIFDNMCIVYWCINVTTSPILK